MSKINRRALIQFLTSTTVCAGSPATIAGDFSSASSKQRKIPEGQERVAIGRQDLPCPGEYTVDLWAAPLSTIFRDSSIHNACARCLIYADVSPDDLSALAYLQNYLSRPTQAWNGKAGEYAQCVASPVELSRMFRSLIEESKSRRAKRRIALIDLDSSMGIICSNRPG